MVFLMGRVVGLNLALIALATVLRTPITCLILCAAEKWLAVLP